MPGLLYNFLLTCLTPTAVVFILLCVAALSTHHPIRVRRCVIAALAVIFISGNGCVVSTMVRSLESSSPPIDRTASADAIVILSGGTLAAVSPRRMIEVADAGDRVLYGAELFREGRAPRIVVTGNVGPGRHAPRPAAEDMADLLVWLGVPRRAILIERRAQNTHEHATNVCPILAAEHVNRMLLVTSALHMRRSIGVFRRSCPGVSVIPAPTDFRPVGTAGPWYRSVASLIPTPRSLLDFSDAAHEYLGLAYYRVRGWIR